MGILLIQLVCVSRAHLIWLLPVESVSDVEKYLEDLDDFLGRLLGDGGSCAVAKHLVSLTPPHRQALLEGFGQHGHSTLLNRKKNTER